MDLYRFDLYSSCLKFHGEKTRTAGPPAFLGTGLQNFKHERLNRSSFLRIRDSTARILSEERKTKELPI